MRRMLFPYATAEFILFTIFLLCCCCHPKQQHRSGVVQAARVSIASPHRKNQNVPPNLFAGPNNDWKSDEISIAPSAIVVRVYGAARNGKGGGMMMMMGSAGDRKTAAPVLAPSPSNSSHAPSMDDDDGNNGKGKGGSGMSSKTSPSSVPSLVLDPTPGKGGGGGMMMMSHPTVSPSGSYEPSVSLTPTNGKGGMMMMMMKSSKGSLSPSFSAAPSLSLYPTHTEKGMSPKKTKYPTHSPAPSTTTKKSMMSKTKAPSSLAPSISSLEPSLIGGKGGGMMMMMMMNGMEGTMAPSMMNSKKQSGPPSSTTLPETLLPTPIMAPAPSSPSAPSPSGQTMNIVRLTPYSLRYTFNQTRVPQTFEVTEVVEVTQMYLAEFFETRLASIMEFQTNDTDTTFVLLQPFLINYTSTAIFKNAATVPPVVELDLLMKAAFSGQNLGTYMDLLQDLPPENSFRTTSNVSFAVNPNQTGSLRSNTKNENGSNSEGDSSKAKRTGGIVAAASVFVLLVISLAMHHQKSKSRAAPPTRGAMVSPKQDPDQDGGHMTIAGDTYLAESTVASGGGMLSRFSRRRRRRNDRLDSSLGRREVIPRAGTPMNTPDEAQSLTLPSIASRSNWERRGSSESGSDEGSEIAIYDADRLLHFHQDPPAYRGALATDMSERRMLDVLSVRDDMRLPRHFSPMDDILNDADGDDNDSLSVDEDVPLRVIDLIRKFTPARKRSASR